ncbi:iron-containing alcohol dehydrogenase [Aeribacillus pallidus]|jgi:Alcohol dehydrogenase, class IV|uniref:Alcohol dehydrogenase n=1 Tax=Aeribacillus pallidus TaxID=33936 RepID=A0A223E130_9BACI|nr:iron-containing alcohol dehydrogenase [Aeribacillus pallidus]ASS88962.1 alcohol dehydrogenase [Aeribacillus pallidus]
MNFEFNIPSQVIFGKGAASKLQDVLAEFHVKRVMCIYDQGVQKAGIVEKVLSKIKKTNVDIIEFNQVLPNPPDTILEKGALLAKNEQIDALIAIGGGSSIDAAKAINILISNPGPIAKYEGVNKVERPTKPLIAIPTTAGTGSEVTGVTVITDTKRKKKMVIAGRNCGADVALVDPELTIALPPNITASTGMDALTHGIEAYVSKFHSIPTDINALKAIELIYSNLEKAFNNGKNIEARTNMLLGSMLAGFAFNSALLGLVHAIAHPLSVYCGLPHGVANACTLPYVMDFNAKDENVQKRFKNVAKAMGLPVEDLSDFKATKQAIEAVRNLSEKVQIPSLSKLGVKREQFDILADATLNEELSILANPREVTKQDILQILEVAY